MIAFLNGRLEEKRPSVALLDVNGVGYEVFIPLGTYDRLPAEGEPCRLFIHHHVREDAQTLFGFAREKEKEMFERLIEVSGIGPKSALGILSGMTVSELETAIAESNVKRISSVRGIGKKTAERIVVELRDKVNALEALAGASGGGSSGNAMLRDTLLALESLGFQQAAARKMAQDALAAHPDAAGTEALLRFALNSK